MVPRHWEWLGGYFKFDPMLSLPIVPDNTMTSVPVLFVVSFTVAVLSQIALTKP